jgi:hypothetical protein
MSKKFASNKRAIAECDRCGFRYLLKQLKKLTIKGIERNIKVCPECWEMDQPQNMLGTIPVDDAQAIRDPRSDQAGYGESRAQVSPAPSTYAFAMVGLVTVTT